MEEILELVGTPIVICSSEGEINWQSKKACEQFEGLSNVREWDLGPSEAATDALEALLNTPNHAVEVWLPTSEGDRHAFLASAETVEGRHVITLRVCDRRPDVDYPVDRFPDTFFRLAPNGEILFASGPCQGKPPGEITGKIFPDLLEPRWGEPFRRLLDDLKGNPREEVSSSRVDAYGESRHIVSRILPILDSQSCVSEFIVQWWDVTADHSAAEALKVTEAQYRQVIENSLDLVAIFDADTQRMQFVSPNCQEFIGRRPEDVVGRNVFEFLDPEDHDLAQQRLRNLIERRTTDETLEATALHADGKTRLFETRARMLANEGDRRLIIMNARDITERRESQLLRRNLMRADKLAAIGQVAASVAHEVNNPASFITTNLHVMREDLTSIGNMLRNALRIIGEDSPGRIDELGIDGNESVDGVLDEIGRMLDTNLEGMARISHIVRELRSFSRTDDDNVCEFVELTDTLRAACNMVRNQISYFAELVEDFDHELPLVYTDRGKVNQVVVNLLVNASQAVQETGRRHDHVVTVRTTLDDAFVRVDIEDTGAGVPEGVADRIFDPFFTTKREGEGTGLGLWLCREIIEKCGGELWLEKTGPDGSIFSFTLPAQSLVEIPESPFEEISSSAHDTVPRARVLLVDDDELVLDSYRKILDPHHDAVSAHGGEHAIKILRRDSRFDVIVCDVIMPGIDGVEFYRFLQDNYPDLLDRIYFCTAGVFTDRTREFVNEVHDRVFHKPISARQLKSLVATASKSLEVPAE